MGKIAETVVVIRGGGDLATGVIQKFFHAGFKVAVLETAHPLAIRRTVALCTAVYTKKFQVEDVTACLVASPQECETVWARDEIPMLIDPAADSLKELQPTILIDGILAKKNLGTHRKLAPITIALGPGFSAPQEVNVVIETMRGHYLGKLITDGMVMPNTGVPGVIGGKSAERVVHAPASGTVKHIKKLGDRVEKAEILFYIDQTPVLSPLEGTLRGLIAEGLTIGKGLKVGDVDPRPADDIDIFSISDKARALGGACLEAALMNLKNI